MGAHIATVWSRHPRGGRAITSQFSQSSRPTRRPSLHSGQAFFPRRNRFLVLHDASSRVVHLQSQVVKHGQTPSSFKDGKITQPDDCPSQFLARRVCSHFIYLSFLQECSRHIGCHEIVVYPRDEPARRDLFSKGILHVHSSFIWDYDVSEFPPNASSNIPYIPLAI